MEQTLIWGSAIAGQSVEALMRWFHHVPAEKPGNTECVAGMLMRIDKAMGWGPQVCMVRRNVIEKLMLQQRAEEEPALQSSLLKYNASHISSATFWKYIKEGKEMGENNWRLFLFE